jgi:putative aminopeptidase FrvX
MIAVLTAAVGAGARAAGAQAAQAAPQADALASWIALDAPTGRETSATDVIARDMPGWSRDAVGNLVARRGSGTPRRVVACGLDDQGYVVSAITDAGYIRLAASGRTRHSALWDQFHEGQRVRILTASGARPAVVAVRSTHLWRRRASTEAVVTTDDLWVDVGARSRAEVLALGIGVLDPVEREWPEVRFADFVAGPAAAARAGCMAVASAAHGTPAHGETIWVIGAQHAFGDAGLAAAVARLGHVDTLVLVGDSARLRSVGTTVVLGLPTRFPGTLVETVRERDIAALVNAVATASGVRAGAPPTVLRDVQGPPAAATGRDSLSAVADVIARLCDTYGASGHEAAVREAVRSMIPKRYTSSVDTAGNLLVAVGPDRDTTVFIAHLDELGFDVVGIDHDGVVTLKPLGGFYSSLWEGQPALLHTPAGQRTGVFVPRATATGKQPDTLTAWFGVDSAELMRGAGGTAALWITGIKHSARLGATRFTNRAIDDRAGLTALLLALADIDPARLDHKVIFAFSVREETGLDGAAALAADLGPTVRRVHAVDTFVSADSPLETGRFAIAPIGDGAVVRALDNSSATPPAEIDRVRRIAAAERIPLQVGVTNGGNDGSQLVRYGAVDVPLAWPLRYSHSPAELIDLADVHALARLVAALAMAPAH